MRCGDARGDAGRLLTLILDAVLRAAPGAADALAERLASVRAPIDAAVAARALERELACVLVEPLVIVFDDAETLTGAPAAVEVIAHLLLSESELVRVALASRHRPDIQLAREQATGRIAELGPADLTFTANESAAFLRQTSGHDPGPAAVQGLMEATDGWPLGVALAASGGVGSAAGPSPALAHQYFSEQTREWSQRVGLSGWIGVALAIRSASLRARSGDVAGAEADLAEVPSAWTVWGTWELDATRATITSLRGDGRGALTAAERAAREATARWPYFDRARCAALLAPALVRAGHPQRARQLVEHTIKSRVPGFSTARLCAVLAWLLHDEGDESGSTAALAAAWQEAGDQITHIVRREWPRLEGPIWVALEHGSIGVDVAVEALAAARPGGAALADFTRHPVPTVRRAALLGSVTAGHPQGFESVPQLLRDPDVTVAAAAGAAAELLRRTPPPLSFRLLGRFELRRGTWLVDDAAWERRIAQRVVRLLLCRGGGPVLEDELIDAFWPDKTADSARRSVQVAVSAARAILDPPGVEHSRLVCTERTYRLRFMEHDTVDAEQFERAAATALAAPADAQRSALLAAASMWTGEPLPEERYAEWSTSWRERLKDRYGEVLAGLSTAHEQAGELTRATSVARALVELDPLNEAAHRRLIVAYARTGRRGHALRQFLECRHALVTALGIEPGEETIALQRRMLGGERI